MPGTFKVLLLKVTCYFHGYSPSIMKYILTQIFHTNLGHAVAFIVEIQKQ